MKLAKMTGLGGNRVSLFLASYWLPEYRVVPAGFQGEWNILIEQCLGFQSDGCIQKWEEHGRTHYIGWVVLSIKGFYRTMSSASTFVVQMGGTA